jgi:hypothetical protein
MESEQLPSSKDSFNEGSIEEGTGGIEGLELLLGGLQLDMPKQKLQFIRTKGHIMKDSKGEDKRTKGHKRGVLLAFIDPEDESRVCIGYSLCHKYDRFDVRQGFHIEGLGTWYALNKADKYKDSVKFVISTLPKHKQLPSKIVKIPQSIAVTLQSFIYRCSKYYKDRDLPKWAVDFALDGVREKVLPETEPKLMIEIADDVA